MIFEIINVGKVRRATIENCGITVIAGLNDTGKTTILKATDLILKSSFGIEKKVKWQRRNSFRRAIRQLESNFDEAGYDDLPLEALVKLDDVILGQIQENFDKLIDRHVFVEDVEGVLKTLKLASEDKIDEKFIDKMYEKLKSVDEREDNEYKKFVTEIYLRNEFGYQSRNLINGEPSEIYLKNENNENQIIFADNKIQEIKIRDFGEEDVVYIETKNILDEINGYFSRNLKSGLLELIRRKRNLDIGEISFEQYKETENNLTILEEIFEDVLHGNLSIEDDIRYKEDRIEEPIVIKNVASGIKIFLIIKRLIENGVLTKGSFLLIDEPECNLHPEWHLKLAEILILLNKEIGINIMLTSHSPYFMRALEVKLASYDMKSKGRFYLMKESDSQYTSEDVTDNTEKIYSQLYRPLELL